MYICNMYLFSISFVLCNTAHLECCSDVCIHYIYSYYICSWIRTFHFEKFISFPIHRRHAIKRKVSRIEGEKKKKIASREHRQNSIFPSPPRTFPARGAVWVQIGGGGEKVRESLKKNNQFRLSGFKLLHPVRFL